VSYLKNKKFNTTVMKNTIFFALSLLLYSTMACEKTPYKVLIVTGQNNHNWAASSEILQNYLNESGLFVADITVSPARGEDMSGFRPDFSAYKAVVIDYNGDSWPDATNAAFLDYVKNGGGVVVYHATSNAFPNWKEFNEIIGLGGWEGRDERHGPYVYYKDDKEVRDYSPGIAGSHGPQHEFTVILRNTEHPITKGLPASWLHARDELYDRLRGPALNMTVLATAYADISYQGSERHEPMLMTIQWGKGRIFHTALGHVGRGTQHPAVECVDFIVTFLRGTEWVVTGKVTQQIPIDFPK
jgi:type 1 glutamine amidotransferase